jgi:uncharacterized protein (DUF433 family)
MQSMTLEATPVPLHLENGGAMRVGKSRVLLELVISAFEHGLTPESIVQRYDTLDLGDVYTVLTYYLHRKDEVNSYLREREVKSAEVRQKIEASQPPRPDLRQRLLARQAQRTNGNAPRGQ